MKIVNLRDAPEHVPTIARWHHDEWGYLNPARSLDARIAGMSRYLTDAPIPTFLLAIDDDDAVIGTAALVESDMDTHPELSPWLASVYVREDKRGQGVGGAVVKALMAFAGDTGITQLHLFTPNQAAFYAALGWTLTSEENYRDTPVTLMQLDY